MATTHGAIHDRALAGFSKSTAYDQHRPAYSSTIVQVLLEQLRVAGQKGATIVDLAAGTGKLTESLAARDEGFKVIAVEPHHGMRDVLANKKLQAVHVVDGTATEIHLEDEAADAVIVAQAFHWFANMDALREIHRVLKPHGVLGILYNAEDYNAPADHEPRTEWEAKVKELSWKTADETGDNEPRFRHLKWKKVFDEQSKSTPLSLIIASEQLFSLPLGEHIESFDTTLSKEEVWDRFNTLGHIASVDGEHKERIHETFKSAINAPDVETNEKGEVVVHGNSYALWTSKIPADGRSSVLGVEQPGA